MKTTNQKDETMTTRLMTWDLTLVSCSGEDIELVSCQEVSWEPYCDGRRVLEVDGVQVGDINDYGIDRIMEWSEELEG